MATGRTAPIWILKAQPDGTQAAQRVDVSHSVLSLSYEDVEKGPDKLTLKVANYDYSNFSNPIFADGTTLIFQFGYGDGAMSPPRRAVVSKVTGGNVLNVEAHGDALLLNLEPKTRAWSQVKRSDVARIIAEEQGYDGAHTFIEDTAVVLPQITQAKITSAVLLRDLAHREGFEFWIDYRGFHFHPRDLGQKPRRAFNYFLDPGQGDILAPPNVENDITTKPGQVQAKGIDPKTKQPINSTASNDTDKGRQGLGYSVEINAVTLQRGERKQKLAAAATMVSTAKNAEDAKRQAQGAYRKIQLGAAIVSFPAIGDPLMEAKCLITLGGAVGVLAGNYYVTKVKHDLTAEYKITITCRRDASGRATGVRSTAAVNGQKATAATSADTQLDRKRTVDPRTEQARDIFVPKGAPPTK